MFDSTKANILKAEVLVTQSQQNPPLSFFQRWFCRPVAGSLFKKSSLSKQSSTDGLISGIEAQRQSASPNPSPKFSLRSKGALLAGTALVMILSTVLAVALALTLDAKRHNHNEPKQALLPRPSSSDQPAYSYTKPPVRLGVLGNLPDPSIYYDSQEKLWYAFATNDAAGILNQTDKPDDDANQFAQSNIQMATSTDFKNWALKPASADPLPKVGAWVAQNLNSKVYKGGKASTLVPLSNVWAPDVIQHPVSGKYLLYYAARAAKDPAHCVGAAVADTVGGPYQPLDNPLACPIEKGGAIDPAAFVDDDNSLFVVYKVDGNSKGHGGECNNMVEPVVSTPIMMQKMLADGVTPDRNRPPIQILDRNDADGPLIEAPNLVKAGDTYFLFYSSGCTRNSDYNIKVATASQLTGPYTRSTSSSLLKTGDFGLYAPGSVSVRWAPDERYGEEHGSNRGSLSNGRWKIALHGRVQDPDLGGVRALFTAGLEFSETSVKLVNGTLSVA